VVLVAGAGAGASRATNVEIAVRGVDSLVNEVHVWRGSLDHAEPILARLRHLLSDDELARADRFHFERDRSRYISGRGQLRMLIGAHLGLAPDEIRFRYGAYEKPHLPGKQMWFNVSHSGSVVLFALTRIGEVGIDVELDDANFARERIAERFFSAREVAVLRSLPAELQARAFLSCWTRKEAFIKARGDGLALPLDSFDVSLAPGQRATLLRTEWSGREPTEWSLSDLSDRGAGYIAAIAVRSATPPGVSRRMLAIDEQTASEQEER
jgi:4'-phosphopantetheinyl transferase